jgi:hypothetical protein
LWLYYWFPSSSLDFLCWLFSNLNWILTLYFSDMLIFR